MAATQASNGVISSLAGTQRKYDLVLGNFDTYFSTIAEATQSMDISKYHEGVEKAKQAMLRLIETQRALMAHSRALDEMQMQYQHPGNAEETNFAALMEAATDRHLSEGFDAEQSSQYQDFLDKVRECGNSQEAAEDEDEDLVMERGNDLAPNRTCPLCQKELLFLDEPVEDSKGFVYEKKDIVDFISRPTFNGLAPISGADHSLSLANLKPARKVLKAQRKAKNQPTQTQADEDDIIEAE